MLNEFLSDDVIVKQIAGNRFYNGLLKVFFLRRDTLSEAREFKRQLVAMKMFVEC